MLNISNIYKNSILKNISFSANKGEIIGLVGPSGSGKTTLLRCIQRLEKVDRGSICYPGISSFMFQDFQLFPHMTVMENITYAPQKIFQMSFQKEACTLLNRLGLSHKAHVYPSTLSGGQKQRVALARCLIMKPNILLCDEPTSGLDVATIDEVIDLLKAVQEVTMVIASHDLDFLINITHRVIVLKDGLQTADVKLNSLPDPIAHLKPLYQLSL